MHSIAEFQNIPQVWSWLFICSSMCAPVTAAEYAVIRVYILFGCNDMFNQMPVIVVNVREQFLYWNRVCRLQGDNSWGYYVKNVVITALGHRTTFTVKSRTVIGSENAV